MSVEDVAHWILENRKGNAFKRWEPNEVIEALKISIRDKGLLFSTEFGQLTGVMVLTKHGEEPIHVVGVVTVKKGLLVKFAKSIKQRFNTVEVTGHRRNGKLVVYDLDKVIKHLKG